MSTTNKNIPSKTIERYTARLFANLADRDRQINALQAENCELIERSWHRGWRIIDWLTPY